MVRRRSSDGVRIGFYYNLRVGEILIFPIGAGVLFEDAVRLGRWPPLGRQALAAGQIEHSGCPREKRRMPLVFQPPRNASSQGFQFAPMDLPRPNGKWYT